MTAGEFLQTAAHILATAGVGTARLDVLVLLEDVLNKDRALILAHPEVQLTAEQINLLNDQISRRSEHVPLAYIRGKTEFYGRDFFINEHVLQPRPESEMMIDLLKKLVRSDMEVRLVDIGSGSGCLGITAALELSEAHIDFIDIDPSTLKVARINAKKHKVIGKFLHNNLLEGEIGPYDVILANLPYVPATFHINQAAMREPNSAIFGGDDGLDFYRMLFEQLHNKAWTPKYLLTEALPPQHEQLASIAAANGFTCSRSDDFIQVFIPN